MSAGPVKCYLYFSAGRELLPNYIESAVPPDVQTVAAVEQYYREKLQISAVLKFVYWQMQIVTGIFKRSFVQGDAHEFLKGDVQLLFSDGDLHDVPMLPLPACRTLPDFCKVHTMDMSEAIAVNMPEDSDSVPPLLRNQNLNSYEDTTMRELENIVEVVEGDGQKDQIEEQPFDLEMKVANTMETADNSDHIKRQHAFATSDGMDQQQGWENHEVRFERQKRVAVLNHSVIRPKTSRIVNYVNPVSHRVDEVAIRRNSETQSSSVSGNHDASEFDGSEAPLSAADVVVPESIKGLNVLRDVFNVVEAEQDRELLSRAVNDHTSNLLNNFKFMAIVNKYIVRLILNAEPNISREAFMKSVAHIVSTYDRLDAAAFIGPISCRALSSYQRMCKK